MFIRGKIRMEYVEKNGQLKKSKKKNNKKIQ